MRARTTLAVVAGLALAGGCHRAPTQPDGGRPDAGTPRDAGQPVTLAATLADPTFQVAQHMRASIEMQLSGEPFAQLLGFNLAGFARMSTTTDLYRPPGSGITLVAPLGYALAVESYEYSKQPMNNLSFESGAGLSLMYGPLLNPAQLTGDAGVSLMLARFQRFAAESQSGGPAGTNLIVSPAPSANPLNNYGWPGLWPQFAEFRSFSPSIQPVAGPVGGCLMPGIGAVSYGGTGGVSSWPVTSYECDYNGLNLPNRDGQVEKVLDPAALGYTAWKQALWSITYWQSLQDTSGNPIVWVDAGDLALVGQPGNAVVGLYPDPTDPTGTRMLSGDAGVYLGDIPMEGWQGLTMMEEIDNKSAFLLSSLLSTDGGAFMPLTPLAAINYAYDSPLVYFPAGVAVSEAATTADPRWATRYFPLPVSLSIVDGTSQLAGLSGLLGGMAEAFALTDARNQQVGGSVAFLATFDGDPFPRDDGLADGENTLHDRALGILKVALVDLDRLHFDPTARVLVDQATVSGASTTRGARVTTTELVESILALRNALRSLNASLQLYSNDTPDALGAPGALDGAPLTGAPYTGNLSARIVSLIAAQADFLSTRLVGPSGGVANGYDLVAGTADPSPTDVAAEAGAIRGLLEAYLATSNATYRGRAVSVYADLQQRFWQTDALLFRTSAGEDSPMQFTPLRFGLLSGALRQYWKLVASAPGHAAEATQLFLELTRVHKVVLNGWNDQNEDNLVQYPQECLSARLEFGERALTGELGNPADNGDRDKDCVREISAVGLPAALGAELDIVRH